MPPRTSDKRIRHFLDAHTQRITVYLQSLPPVTPLLAETTVPVLGTDYTLPDTSSVRMHLTHMLREAIEEILSHTMQHSQFEAFTDMPTIEYRDPVSRWGSCNRRTKRIMLSWRLVFAPDAVARYVLHHECAHLLHPNHSSDFWACVTALDPHMRKHDRWLLQHGQNLFQYAVT